MNQWAINRKRIILGTVLVAILILVGIPFYLFLNTTPTCFDGQMNGGESGVDCGGACQLLCASEALSLIMKSDPRVLELATSTYAVVILVENPNVSGQVFRAPYTINVYGATSLVPLQVIQGETFIPKNSSFGIFQGPFAFIQDKPVRATFAWREEGLIWEKNTDPTPNLNIKDGFLLNTDRSPRLEASVSNPSLVRVSNIELVALISDSTGSIVAASKTFVDVLGAGEVAPIIFTWPMPFVGQGFTVEIVPRILPDKSFI